MSKTNTKADINILADEINKLGSDSNFNLVLQLSIAGLLLDKLLDVESRKIGHSKKRYQILYFIILHGGTVKATSLSKELFNSKQALTKIIDGLEKEGLVARNSKNKDRRVKDIVITKKGIEEIKKALPL
ncbi:MAG: MarR family transcriptional regulator, partial [Dehalococcoidales bacterium]|nr:MarR family transcriptional regulator [Dehalococcoidales bacterium]